MATLSRAELIALLERLSGDDDQAVLAAARELDRHRRESGLSWEELLESGPEPEAEAQDAGSPFGADEDTASGALEAARGDRAEDLKIIERLRARRGTSKEMLEELADLKQRIADGTFDKVDSRYVRALAKRLGV